MQKKMLRKKSIGIFFAVIIAALSIYIFSNRFSAGDKAISEEMEESKNKLTFIEAQWRQEFEKTKDLETGTVPKERLFSAIDIKMEREAAMRASNASRGIPGINWVERGPSNVGGRTRAVIFDRNDPTFKRVFAGAIAGGLWRCEDITLATPVWTRVSDTYENIGISAIVQNPTNPQIMYFSTGEGWFNLGAQNGLGIWKSTDGGNTWNHLPSTIGGGFTTVQEMVVASNGDVYAAASPLGVMKSKDGGLTWRNVLSGGSAADIGIAANGDFYATVGIFSPGSLWKSVAGANAGEPGTWTNITPASPTGFQRMEMGLSASDANTLYVLCQGGASNDGTDMFRTVTGGSAWIACNINSAVVQDPIPTNINFSRGQAWYDLVCEVDPLDPMTVYIGGVDVHKSIDGGANFTPLTKWTSLVTPSPAIPVVHADQHDITFRPGSSNIALFGNDGGVFYGNNLTLPTYTIVTKDFGYNVTQFYAVAMHPTAGSNYFLAGAQDNGTQRFNGGAGITTTTEATGGDGAFCHIDQDQANNQFTSYVYSSFYRSTNGGTSFSNTINDATHGQFISPTDYDNVANVFYSDYTLVSTRVGGAYGRWPISGSTNTGITVTNFNSASVSNVYVSPNIANRVYFGLANGSIVYVNNANTVTSPTAGVVIRTGSGSVSSIAIEKTNENHILATYSNYGLQSVWETTDGGATWNAVEGNLPDMPVRWVVINPTNADQALIATELGVWSTDDLNGASTEWNPTGNNMPNCRVDMLQVRESDNTIAVATYGRGVYTTTLTNTDVPMINFAKQTTFTSESNATTLTGCGTYGYKEIPLTLYISKAPVGDAVVNISLNPNSTASNGQDYVLSSNTVTFPSGSSAPQTVNVRVYNDHAIEPTEYLEISISSITGTTDAVKNTINQNFSLELLDDEVVPADTYTGKLQVGDFTTNLGGSSPLQGSQSDKKMQFIYRASDLIGAGIHAGEITGFSFNIGTKGSVEPFVGLTIKMGQVAVNDLAAGFVSTGGFSTVYTAPAGGYRSVAGVNEFPFASAFIWDGTSNIVFEYCYNNVAAPPTPPVAVPAGSGDDILKGQGTGYMSQAKTATTNVPGDDGCAFPTATLKNTFRPLIKLFQVQPQTPVETVLNSTDNYNLGAFETVYFYTAGKIAAKIENLSNWNYGCVNLNVDRAGTGAVAFNNNNPLNYLTSKTMRFTPQFDNPTGAVRFTIYYTNVEKTGWESATGSSWAAASIVKVKGHAIPEVTPSNTYPLATEKSINTATGMLGVDHFIAGTFATGFSGIAAGVFENATLAVNFVNLSGIYAGTTAQLRWNVNTDQYLQYTTLERSYDGINFMGINNTFTTFSGDYNYSDQPTSDKVYYRIRYARSNGSVLYSNIILLNKKNVNQIKVSPNPFTNYLQIVMSNQANENIMLELTDMAGNKIYRKEYRNFNGQLLSVDLKDRVLAKGVYILTLTTKGNKESFSVICQ